MLFESHQYHAKFKTFLWNIVQVDYKCCMFKKKVKL